MSKPEPGWVRVPDEDVWHVWACEKCESLIHVEPTFYGEAGTPVCEECGDDMEYSHTLVKTKTRR